MTTGFAGDWHGNGPWAHRALALLKTAGATTIYHLGDFGLWPGPGGKQFLRTVQKTADLNGQTLYIVLGNHEDYSRVPAMRADDNGWLCLPAYPRLKFAPRGHTWVDRGTRMAALGGAGSIDLRLRTPGRSWWPEEEIAPADCATLTANVREQAWDRVDVMLTHEAPAGLRRVGMTPKPQWFTPEVEHYVWNQRVLLREALDTVRPRWLAHGHWHEWFRDAWDGTDENGRDYTCDVLGLDCDGTPNNLAVADLCPGVGLIDLRCLGANGFIPLQA
jgi:hypothetical protein